MMELGDRAGDSIAAVADKSRSEIHWLTEAPRVTGRSNGLDIVRAVCAISVVIDHAIFWARGIQGKDSVPASIVWFFSKVFDPLWQPSGEVHPAVLVFIVLSGYCIHRATFRESPQSVFPFAIRRAFRILPVYFAAIAAGLGFFIFAHSFSPALATGLTGLASFNASCLLAKISTLGALVPIPLECTNQGNGPLVTVMVEIILYAGYALAFVGLVWRRRESALWFACALAFAVNCAVAAAAPSNPNLYSWWQNSSFIGFLPYWWLGAAVLSPRVRGWLFEGKLLWVALSCWLLFTIVLMFVGDQALISELRKLTFAVTASGIIVALDEMRSIPDGFLPAIGRAGYSVYAFHAPLVMLLCMLGISWWLAITGAIVGGWVVYRVYEAPLQRVGRTFART